MYFPSNQYLKSTCEQWGNLKSAILIYLLVSQGQATNEFNFVLICVNFWPHQIYPHSKKRRQEKVPNPDMRMLSKTVAPTAMPANSPTCHHQFHNKKETKQNIKKKNNFVCQKIVQNRVSLEQFSSIFNWKVNQTKWNLNQSLKR